MGSVESRTSQVGDVAGSLREHVSSDTVKQQTAGAPLAAGLLTFGIGFLVAAVMPATEPETQAAQRLQGQLEPAKEALKESGQHLAGAVKEEASGVAGDLKGTASQAAGRVAETAKDEAQATKEDAADIRS